MSAIPEALEYHTPFDASLIMTGLTIVGIALLSFLATKKIRLVPKGAQNVLESILKFIYELADDVVGPKAAGFYPLFSMLFFFILFSNLLGLIPGLFSSTSKLSTTFGLALIVFLTTHYVGVKECGFVNYVKHWFGPVPLWLKPLVFVIEIISELARPLSLAFRLFGNILAKEILLAVLALLIVTFIPSNDWMQKGLSTLPILLRPAIVLLGLLVSIIQAYVFMLLSMVYVGGAMNAHEGH